MFYLKDGNSDIFVGKLYPGAKVVHNIPLVGSQRRFKIISLINTSNWNKYYVEKHQIGSFIAWDLKDSELKVHFVNICPNYCIDFVRLFISLSVYLIME